MRSIVSFTLKDIRDSHGYLEALGKPRIAEVKRDAQIAQAEADRDAQVRSALAHQLGEIARIEAETKIAEANRDFQSRKAEYDAAVNLKRAEADLAYDIQKNRTSQELKKEEIQIAVVEKEQQIVVQEREIQRRDHQLPRQAQPARGGRDVHAPDDALVRHLGEARPGETHHAHELAGLERAEHAGIALVDQAAGDLVQRQVLLLLVAGGEGLRRIEQGGKPQGLVGGGVFGAKSADGHGFDLRFARVYRAGGGPVTRPSGMPPFSRKDPR